ncbi:MAG: hypothetical protein ABIL52_02910 [candidate division WOR-3 bacterium]
MFSIIKDSLILISDTFLPINGIILNSFYSNKAIEIKIDSFNVYLKALEDKCIVYYEKLILKQDIEDKKIFKTENYENYANLDFFGNAFLKFGISSNLEQSQGITANILGNYNEYKLEGVIKSRGENRTITLEELEESYLLVSSKDFYSNVGVFLFGNFRIFGINMKKNDYYLTFGYERAQFTRIELYLDENNRGPYRFTENYNIVYGSVNVYLNGQKVNEKDYIIDYQMGTITFKANVIIKKGDKLTIEYQFFESDGRREHLQVGYKNGSVYQRRKILKYESDTIKYIESAGYYPSYYKSNNGSYIKQDSIFIYVGEGKGEYVVRFSPFIGGSYNYDNVGNFYYFVGKGKGNYEPVEYYEPPILERELNLEFLNNKLTIFEFNRNYYKYKYGELNFEGNLEFNYNQFKLGLIRKKRIISDYTFSNNLMFSNTGNYLYLKFKYIEPYILDSMLGIKFNHKNLYFEAISNRRKLNFILNRDIFDFEYEYLFVDSAFNRIKFKTNTSIYPIYVLRYSKEIENEVGIGINSNILNFIGFYNVQKQSYEFRIYKNSQILNFDISYINQPDVIYIERFIFVGEGLGNYSYDPKTNSYYPDNYGSYIKQIYPFYLNTSKSEIIGNINLSYKNFELSMFKNKDNIFIGLSSLFLQLSYNKQINYEELNNQIKIKYIKLKNKYVYQDEKFNYIKTSMGLDFNNFEFGFGAYLLNVPFFYVEFRKILNLIAEYRISEYNEYIKKGIDLNANISYIFGFKNYNIIIFGLFGYNNLRTVKSFGINLSLKF